MGKNNMNFTPSLFLLNKHTWLWPSCNTHPKTLSFRATVDDHRLVMNPNYKESLVEEEQATLGSCFTNSSEYSPSISSESYSSAVETIIRGAWSERLFFEPYSTSCSILEAQGSGSTGTTQCSSETGDDSDGDISGGGGLVYKESVAMVVETEDPYVDFRKSMEEMVEMHDLKDWDCLEELLGWYLRMNEKDNHEFIVGAFFDLLAGGCRLGGRGGGDGGVSYLDHCIGSSVTSASTCSSPTLSPNGNNK